MIYEINKILLIQPFVEEFYYTDIRKYPLGLTYLAGAIKKKFPEINVKIIDLLTPYKKRSIKWPKEFSYLEEYFGNYDNSPFSLFHKYYHFGKNEEEVRDILRKENPSLIGISSLFTPYYRETKKVIEIIRDVLPHAIIVVGGNHASISPETFLRFDKNESSDYVIKGEGEKSFISLIKLLTNHDNYIKNIKIEKKYNGTIIEEDINIEYKDTFFPDTDSLDIKQYKFNNRFYASVFSSIGCPFNCSFCSIHNVFKKYKQRDINEVIKEIIYHYNNGIKHINFEDDNLTLNKSFALALFNEILKLKLDISFSAMNGLSYESLDFELLKLMQGIGFISINLAIVSKNELFIKNIGRPHSYKKFEEIIFTLNKINLPLQISFILGMPGQTLIEMFETLLYLSSLKCLIQPSPFFLTPGTRIYNDVNKSNNIYKTSKNADSFLSARLTAMDIETESFNRIDIYTLWRLTRVINYLKNVLDDNSINNNFFFNEATNVFRIKKWFFYSKKEIIEAPFSESVKELLNLNTFTVKGYKTDNVFFWNKNNQKFIKG